MYIFITILAIGMLIVLHELGHFFAAKISGVDVNEFWIGMGPCLLKKEFKGTVFKLNLLPFGGAVIMDGETGESQGANSFQNAKKINKAFIMISGCLMNFLTAFIIILFLSKSFSTSINACIIYTKDIFLSFKMLFSGDLGVNDLSGVVSLTVFVGQAAEHSMSLFWELIAIVSINLGIMNLLPIPALDGGRLILLLIETVRGKPLNPKIEGTIHGVCLLILFGLMGFLLYHDIFVKLR